MFNEENGRVNPEEIAAVTKAVEGEVTGLASNLPFAELPPPVRAAAVPILFEEGLTSEEIEPRIEKITGLAQQKTDSQFYVTGPAGIANDTTALFSRADLVLLLSVIKRFIDEKTDFSFFVCP